MPDDEWEQEMTMTNLNLDIGLFDALTEIDRRPEPFETYTARDLQDDEHASRNMLAGPRRRKQLDRARGHHRGRGPGAAVGRVT